VKIQQNLIALTVEKYLSGVALNAGSSEETIAVQNADLLDRSLGLVDRLLPFLGLHELFKRIDNGFSSLDYVLLF
jgi:hypothetical protein